MSASRSRAAHLLTAAVAVASLVGCSSGDDDRDDEAGARPSSAAPSSGSAAPTESPTVEPASLVANPPGIRIPCSTQRSTGKVSMYSLIAEARGDLTLVGASASGTNVRLVAAQGVIVTSRSAAGPGGRMDSIWPMDDDRLRRKTDISTRQELRGMEVRDGQRVLPLFRVRVTRQSHLDSFSLTWTDAVGTYETVEVPIGTQFSPTCSA